MTSWLSEMCSTAFMPHGQCYLWQPELIGLHAISDSLIALAYFSIPLTMLYFVRRRHDLPFPAIFLMFGAFIVACGTTHLMEVITIWQPAYWFSGGVKLVTAAISLVSAVALVRIVPLALELPSQKDLRRLNEELEARATARTAELTAANEKLRREVGQREQAEAEVHRLNLELSRRLAELQTLFNVMPVGVCIASEANCRELRINPAYAEMHGLPFTEGYASFSGAPMALPKTFRALRDGQEIPEDEMPLPRAIATNAIVRDFEKSIMRDDGTTIEVLATAVPIRDEAGRVTGCVGTYQDITAHKQAERQRLDFERKLQQSQKLESIGVLAGGVAHDFNNLLQGVLGNASLARSQLARGPADVDPLLAQVELSAQRAADLCRQLLAYAGKGRFVVKPLDLNVAVRESLPLLKLSVSKKITLNLDLAPGLPPFRGDATQINQVLMNLVINAAEAIGDRVGTITISTRRATLTPMDLLTFTTTPDTAPGDYVRLAIEDDGCGIAAEAMPHLFEPFFTTKFIGRGLGLASVLGIVQGHRSALRVDSKIGVGTTFELFFPVLTQPATVATPTAPTRAPFPSGAARGTVLIVDDEETVRKFAATVLADAGFTAVTAADGNEALEQVRRAATRFDAVLLDLTMPNLDGEDTLVALRMIAPTLPVILTSGYHEQAGAQRFVARGLAEFLPKPFAAGNLVALVTAALAHPREGR